MLVAAEWTTMTWRCIARGHRTRSWPFGD